MIYKILLLFQKHLKVLILNYKPAKSFCINYDFIEKTIMILWKKFICENWTRIKLSELLENCLQESFEISYSREFIWQKFLQIKYQFIQIDYNRIPIIWILKWEKVGLSSWLKTGKNVFKMLTWTLNLYF